ncbi:hypothetical protein [Phycicoccus flavus]|uniref:hypothetical protein n=1 Tax=Phycicoccus flavus TaxID=2502783 RepID=UPI000FEBB47B|nr:hypothetical protein [Phycicoccus flavus]NHA70048.1 hypothetical protein [Phycicoccus flavus]
MLPRLAGTGGIVWGAVLLASGDEVWRRLEGRDPDLVEELGIRVLGGRHLLQGLAQLVAPRATSGVVVGVDVVHAVTMGALAVGSSTRRRAALVTGGVALASAAVTRLGRRSDRPR